MSYPSEDMTPSPFRTAFMASVFHRPLHDGSPRNENDVLLSKYLVDMINLIMDHVHTVEDTEVKCLYAQHDVDKNLKDFESEKTDFESEKTDFEAEKTDFEAEKTEFYFSRSSVENSMDLEQNIHREIVKDVADAVCICNGPPEEN